MLGRKAIHQHHGQRIRFLSGGTAGTPYSNRPRTFSPCTSLPSRQDLLLQKLEMHRLPEKMRLISSDGINHGLAFLVVHGDPVVVLRKIVEPQGTQAPGESACQKSCLRFSSSTE